MKHELIEVPMSELLIDADFNCRGFVAPVDVIDLAKDMEAHGLDTPITVERYTDPHKPKIQYRVIAGHRRSTAAKVLKWEKIPAYLRTFEKELDRKTMSLRENLHRSNLNIKQEAHALKPYLAEYWPADSIAEILNQSKGWVNIRLDLLKLCDKVQDYAAAGLINQSHIRAMKGMSETKQLEFVNAIKQLAEKGDILTVVGPQKKEINSHVKKPRKREEILTMVSEIYGILQETGFWSRCLAWAAGEISTYELHKDIVEEAAALGYHYEIPEQMLLERIGAV